MKYERLVFQECQKEVCNIRRKVFIEEQNCPEDMEWDENEEKESLYFVAFHGDLAVGCLRLRNVEENLLKMERVAVLKQFRRRGIASELIRESMLYVQTEHPNSSIYAYAQVSALQAYVSLGFTVLSNVWIEDGTFIPHQTIFWGTPVAIDIFLKQQSEKQDVSYEEYDARHPSILSKIKEFKKRLEDLDTWNFRSLHVHLEDRIVSKIIRQRFSRFCENIEQSILGDRTNICEFIYNSSYLLNLADEKLNTGHFNEVDENWRRMYSMTCFCQSFVLLKQEKLEIAIEIADKGLCMGRISDDLVPLRQLAYVIHEQLPVVSSADLIHSNYCFNNENPNVSLKPLGNTLPIDECMDDNEDSYEKLMLAVQNETPLLVRRHALNMPAVEKWSFPFLLNELHSRTFPVEIGTKYSDEDWSQKLMTFKDFIINSDNQRLYLAQHRLFDQVPHLKKDIIIPEVCFRESINAENIDMNMWIGPANTVSPLHTDPRKNMFVQIHGTKLFRLIAPEDSEKVYPFDGILSNTSQVDAENPDLVEFPDFAKTAVYDAVVHPGDALFIPEKWWHFVRSATPSISISLWFD